MWWPLLVALLPLLIAAVPALKRPRELHEQLLLLWPAAALAVYIVIGSGSRGAALEGVSLPLSVLAVRGWRRLATRRAITYAALFLAIVPGAVYSAQTFHDIFRSKEVPFGLRSGEQRAVNSMAGRRGSVLATPYLAPALPALVGLLDGQVYAGSNTFFDGRGGAAGALSTIREGRVTTVVSDCLRGRADLAGVLGQLGFAVRTYGCARVYERPRVS